MPEDSKKKQHKTKNDPKEQRRPRHRQQAAVEKKLEKNVEEPKVTAPTHVNEEPGPEFYKNLKRETDEILKITEEANSKYKKKEIQSNWSKYEMPIESYEDMEEQENMGADYEKLIAAPLSIGGHFQFKHEKSWDITTEPSLYDKYFDIDMNNLALALSTVPFYERNNIEKSVFSQTDILSMDNRATRYKQKYYIYSNDKSYTNSELEAEEKLINTLKECFKAGDEASICTENVNTMESVENKRSVSESKDIIFEPESIDLTLESNTIDDKDKIIEETSKSNKTLHEIDITKKLEDIDDIILDKIDNNLNSQAETKLDLEIKEVEQIPEKTLVSQVADNSNKEHKTNPIIESPEDLEKWLDDFLDG